MAADFRDSGLTTGHAPFVEEARDRGELYITQAYELYSEENHEAWRSSIGASGRAGSGMPTIISCAESKLCDLPADRIPRLAGYQPPAAASDRIPGQSR